MNDEFLRGMAALDAVPPVGDDRPIPQPIDENAVWSALSRVIDPEIGLDIVTLGLVYGLECTSAGVRITFSLTTPGCPLEEVITRGIVEAVTTVPGVEEVVPDLVWEPRWHPGMIGEGAW